MVVEQNVLEACIKGVLIERGFEPKEADDYIKGLSRPRPDKSLVELTREVASIILTLHAHGLIRETTN